MNVDNYIHTILLDTLVLAYIWFSKRIIIFSQIFRMGLSQPRDIYSLQVCNLGKLIEKGLLRNFAVFFWGLYHSVMRGL